MGFLPESLKNMYGKEVEGVIRSTFVIDPEGIIKHALYNVKAKGHAQKVLDLL
ncbi:thiol peroxidase, Bcp-type [Helicobacter suis]|uniref:thiol peroxidase, Bcp-type n=1 Tax=Helicobacter suis TaxID=104628 RepID=UPI00249371F3